MSKHISGSNEICTPFKWFLKGTTTHRACIFWSLSGRGLSWLEPIVPCLSIGVLFIIVAKHTWVLVSPSHGRKVPHDWPRGKNKMTQWMEMNQPPQWHWINCNPLIEAELISCMHRKHKVPVLPPWELHCSRIDSEHQCVSVLINYRCHCVVVREDKLEIQIRCCKPSF